jgi:hypothetical protein
MAYVAGINQYIEIEVTPIEFQLVQSEKRKNYDKDVYNIYGCMLDLISSKKQIHIDGHS